MNRAVPDPDLRAALTRMLYEEKQLLEGRLPHGRVAAAAELLGLSRKQVSRDIAAGGYMPAKPRESSAYELPDLVHDLVWQTQHNIAAIHRRIPEAERPSYATVHRAVKREISRATKLDITHGTAERRQGELMLLREYERPFELLAADEHEVSAWIRHPIKKVPVKPWVALVRDGCCGGIAGASGSPDPITAELFNGALLEAISGESDLGPFGGLPEAFQWDQAACHTANRTTLLVCRFHIPVFISDGYHPHQNGIIESFNNYIELDYARCHPFYADGAEDLRGDPILPHPDALPSFDEFWAEFRAWLRDYNHTFPQRRRGKKSAVAIWNDSKDKPTPIDPLVLQELAA
jgi:transposase InsO family protein